MMGYSLTEAGELFTYSGLSDYYPIDDVLKLPEPKGRKFIESFDQSTNHITFDELNDFINNRNLSSISRILNNKTDDIRVSFEFQEGVNEKTFNIWKRRFIKTLNTHERSKLNPNSRTSALKNRIVNQIETLMLDPINIINMLNPISMDNAKDAASKTTLGNREKLMNYDVPTSMMIMQYQNMLGKNVIGSAASGLKAYFGELTYFNNIIDQIYNQLINNDSPQNIFENIKRIVFDGKYNSNDIRILGNTPLRKLINILDLKPNFKTLVLNNPNYNSKMQSHLKGYITNNILNFEKLLLDLEKTAWEYNTSQNISEILSAATDNAKELILAKINATLEFSDIYTYLITTGVSIPEIAEFMTSPIFNIVSKFAKNDIFATGDRFHDLDRTIEFVLDEKSLYSLPNLDKTFKQFLSDYKDKHTDVKSDFYELLRTNKDSRIALVNYLTEKCKTEKAKLSKKNYNEYGEFNDNYESQLDTMAPEDMTPVKPKTTYHEYLDIYNYVVRHLIPKNEMLDALDYNKSKKTLETLRDKILPGVEEQKAIASFFSINKGIETKDWDEYNWIEKQNKKINKMYLDRELKDAVKFDFVLFTKDEYYRNEQIKQFENIKTTFNVLDVITKVNHFWEMLKTVGLNRDLINTAAIFRLERKLEKEVLNKSDVLTPTDTRSISNKDWRVLSNYTRDVVTLNWFMRQPNLTISIPEDWEYYIANLSNSRIPKKYIASEPGKRLTIKLNTQEGIATFKRIVENHIIPSLKTDPDFKDNMFIQHLRRDAVPDNSAREFIRKYSFPFSLTNIEKGSTFERLYESIVKSFNRDMYKDVGAKFGIGSWSLGDLFFVYNLIVNKEGFGRSSMTKIFEDSINYGNEVKTAESYYNYIKLLDSESFNLSELRYDIDDLKMRLAESSAAYNYGVSVNKTDKNNPVIKITKGNGSYSIPILGRNLSDFTFNMWQFGSKGYETLPSLSNISITNFNKTYEPTLDNKEVLNTVVDLLVERIGNNSKIPVKVVSSADIQIMYGNRELQFATEETFSNTLNANSFIYNGVVYINSDNTKLDSPIHEFFHIICAGLKFSRRKAVRELYYKLLNDIAGVKDEAAEYYKEIGNAYADKHGSDLKEEVLVRALSDKFKNEFTSNWSKLISNNYDEAGNKIETLYSHQLKQAIIDTLNETLGTSISDNIKEDELGNYTLEQALVLFKSKLFELDGDWLTKTSISNNQTVATIKDRLVKTGDLKIGENC